MLGMARCAVRTPQRGVPTSFDRQRITRFVFCYEYLAEVIECTSFDFALRAIHQVQIEMQVVQRD